MSKARAKGTQWETQIVRWLNENGYPGADRSPLRGNKDRGDITGLPGVCIEAKNHKQMRLAEWLDQLAAEMVAADADSGVLIVKRAGTTDVGRSYALMPVDVWLRLLKEAGR